MSYYTNVWASEIPDIDNKNIINQLSNLTIIFNEKLDIKIGTNDEPSSSQTVLQNQDDNASISTRRDADNDVIMKITILITYNKYLNLDSFLETLMTQIYFVNYVKILSQLIPT